MAKEKDPEKSDAEKFADIEKKEGKDLKKAEDRQLHIKKWQEDRHKEGH